jgi:hypothetical protein
MAAKINQALLSFNRGEVSKHALGRLDVEQFRLAAETQINWVPLTLGPMMFRPGLKHLGSTYNDSVAKFIPFVFSVDDTALLEFTDALMRIWVDDAVLTAPSVSTTVTNGDFSAAGSWTLSATPAGAASSAITGGLLSMNAEGVGSVAYAEQAVSVGASDIGVVHRLRVHVGRFFGHVSGRHDFGRGGVVHQDDAQSRLSLACVYPDRGDILCPADHARTEFRASRLGGD